MALASFINGSNFSRFNLLVRFFISWLLRPSFLPWFVSTPTLAFLFCWMRDAKMAFASCLRFVREMLLFTLNLLRTTFWFSGDNPCVFIYSSSSSRSLPRCVWIIFVTITFNSLRKVVMLAFSEFNLRINAFLFVFERIDPFTFEASLALLLASFAFWAFLIILLTSSWSVLRFAWFALKRRSILILVFLETLAVSRYSIKVFLFAAFCSWTLSLFNSCATFWSAFTVSVLLLYLFNIVRLSPLLRPRLTRNFSNCAFSFAFWLATLWFESVFALLRFLLLLLRRLRLSSFVRPGRVFRNEAYSLRFAFIFSAFRVDLIFLASWMRLFTSRLPLVNFLIMAFLLTWLSPISPRRVLSWDFNSAFFLFLICWATLVALFRRAFIVILFVLKSLSKSFRYWFVIPNSVIKLMNPCLLSIFIFWSRLLDICFARLRFIALFFVSSALSAFVRPGNPLIYAR